MKTKHDTKHCVTKCVLAGDKTHFQVNGKMVCGSTENVFGEYVPKDTSQGVAYLLPVCKGCKKANTDRWRELA